MWLSRRVIPLCHCSSGQSPSEFSTNPLSEVFSALQISVNDGFFWQLEGQADRFYVRLHCRGLWLENCLPDEKDAMLFFSRARRSEISRAETYDLLFETLEDSPSENLLLRDNRQCPSAPLPIPSPLFFGVQIIQGIHFSERLLSRM
ncbi:hypothetical protein BaRGS_00023185 [Batillaria attramentaria]|uniref:Uncharacterized protein n=1 Tax=Batillaria attramentaria TaxID=370345 RepID=A0ABD0KER9_9CAEN